MDCFKCFNLVVFQKVSGRNVLQIQSHVPVLTVSNISNIMWSAKETHKWMQDEVMSKSSCFLSAVTVASLSVSLGAQSSTFLRLLNSLAMIIYFPAQAVKQPITWSFVTIWDALRLIHFHIVDVNVLIHTPKTSECGLRDCFIETVFTPGTCWIEQTHVTVRFRSEVWCVLYTPWLMAICCPLVDFKPLTVTNQDPDSPKHKEQRFRNEPVWVCKLLHLAEPVTKIWDWWGNVKTRKHSIPEV